MGNVSEWLLDSSSTTGPFPLDGSAYLSPDRIISSRSCDNQYAAGISHLTYGVHPNYQQAPNTINRLTLSSNYDCRFTTRNVGFRPVRPAKSWRKKRLPILE